MPRPPPPGYRQRSAEGTPGNGGDNVIIIDRHEILAETNGVGWMLWILEASAQMRPRMAGHHLHGIPIASCLRAGGADTARARGAAKETTQWPLRRAEAAEALRRSPRTSKETRARARREGLQGQGIRRPDG